MDKTAERLETVEIFRCPECGVRDTGLTPTETDVFEVASETSGEILCSECDTIVQPPQEDSPSWDTAERVHGPGD